MAHSNSVTRLVGWVGWTTAGLAFVFPKQMLLLWPKCALAPQRLMQGWALATLALSATLWGAPPEGAVMGLCALSIPWDLRWGGRMGAAAATLNAVCAGALYAAHARIG